MDTSLLPRPAPDPEAAPFWEWCAKGELRLQRCDACGVWRHPPRPRCWSCRSAQRSWQAVTGRGRIHSFTVCHPPVLPAFADEVPYVVAVVRLDEGPFLATRLVGSGLEAVAVEDRAQVELTDVGAGLSLPLFRLAPDEPDAAPVPAGEPTTLARADASGPALIHGQGGTGRAAVAGIGQTVFAKGTGRTELDLACEAVLAACEDAGVDPSEVDGLVSYHVEQVSELDLTYTLGLGNLTFFAMTPSGGGGAASILGLAALAVTSGQASHVIAYRARCRSKGASYGADPNQGGRPWAKGGSRAAGAHQWHHPFGLAAPAQEMAIIARRHMHVYGTTAEQFGLQAVAQRRHASTNPAAIMRAPITLDDWRASRPIAEPIRLVDCSLENDGAVAVLVTSTERAADLRQRPVRLLAGAQGVGPIHTQLSDWFRWTSSYDGRDHAGRAIARRLWARAGVGPADVDVAAMFDHFTMAVPLTLEQYGFCPPGQGGPFIESGATGWPDGTLPVNTHGGSNGEAFIHGANHLLEVVRQLRGTAVNQVAGAEVAFVNGSITDPAGAVVLAR